LTRHPADSPEPKACRAIPAVGAIVRVVSYRDGLPDDGTRERYDEAIAAAARTFARACHGLSLQARR
jgi:hypothetical protein